MTLSLVSAEDVVCNKILLRVPIGIMPEPAKVAKNKSKQ
jgi:hypothetical protein